MKHHKALLALAMLTAALVGSWTNDTKPVAHGPQTPQATVSPTPTPPAKAPTYSMPANLCGAVSADAFADLAPGTPPQTAERGDAQTTSSTCQLTVGKLDNTILVSVSVDLFTNDFGAPGTTKAPRG